MVFGLDPLRTIGGVDPRIARLRPGFCGGRVMGDRDFSDEQKRYLEGFVSGVQASRAAAGLKPLAGVGGTSEPTGPDAAHHKAMARFEAQGRKLSAEEKAKREEHP